jgi:hypothetical protein
MGAFSFKIQVVFVQLFETCLEALTRITISKTFGHPLLPLSDSRSAGPSSAERDKNRTALDKGSSAVGYLQLLKARMTCYQKYQHFCKLLKA